MSVYRRIKMVIEETNDAFSAYGSMNTDYAEFATLSLSEFKHALSNPHLTDRQLKRMIRTGMSKHKNADPGSCWATFMARHVANTSNKNIANTASTVA